MAMPPFPNPTQRDFLNMCETINNLIEINYLHRLLSSVIEQTTMKKFKKAEKKAAKTVEEVFEILSKELRKRKFSSFEELLFFEMIQRTVSDAYFKKYGGVPEGRNVSVAYQ